jgi:MYXO-CTERM domain-containing protein
MSGSQRGDVSFGAPNVAGDLDATAVTALVGTRKNALVSCYQTALDRGASLSGSASVRLTVGTDGAVRGSPGLTLSGRDETFESCVQTQLSSLRFPPPQNGAAATVTLPMTLSSTPADPWQTQNRLMSFVLTRLHARYSKEALGEDLVFRPADPIVGGREFVQSEGKLEEGSRPSDVNNFQARYAIRHPWEGPITCDNPRRGVWGGPPAGVGASSQVRPALDLAFAPRGNLTLPEMLRQNVPELALNAPVTTQALLQGASAVGATGAAAAAGAATEESGGCGSCSSTGMPAPITAAFALLALVGLLQIRRPRS